MIIKRKNDVEYCDCLDWNDDFKQRQLSTMVVFNHKLHTTGVTKKEREAFYITLDDKTPEQLKLAKQLTQLIKEV